MTDAAEILADRPPATPSGRRLITLDDFFAMMEAGIIEEGERSELIEGELFVMPGEGDLHVDYTDEFTDALAAALPNYIVRQRGVLNRQPHTQLSPDVAVWPKGTRARAMTPENVLLIVEVSDTTARGDKRQKAPVYARAGVAELWIMDVRPRRLLVYRNAVDGVWPEPLALLPGESIAPLFAPEAIVIVPGF